MIDDPILSIIIPFYNAKDKINFLLESLNKQELSFVELIFINDGSKSDDNSGQLISSYFLEKNIRYRIINKLNGGVSSARNNGILEAKGAYVMFLDSDDALTPNAIRSIKYSLLNSTSDILIFEYVSLNENKKNDYSKTISKYVEPKSLSSSDFLECYLKGEFLRNVHLCSCVFKLCFLLKEKLTFNEALAYGEDQSFVIFALKMATNIKYYNTTILAYINYENSATGVFSLNWFDSYYMFNSLLNDEYYVNYNKTIKSRMNWELVSISNNFIKKNKIKTAYLFIKEKILPLKRNCFSIKYIALFFTPFFYILFYKLYTKVRNAF